MKKVLTILAVALGAAMVFSCKEDQPQVNLPTATLAADEAFVDGKANITVTLSAASPVDVTATIAYGNAREGRTAIDIAALKFNQEVTLRAGEKTVSCTVELLSTEKIADGAEAPIALAGVSAADYGALKCDVAIAYIVYNAPKYDENDPNNPNNPDNPDNPGQPDEEGLTLRTDWTATLDGDPYWYGNTAYFDVIPTVPGIKYFWLVAFSDEEMDVYFEGSVKSMIDIYAESVKDYLANGDDIEEILFFPGEEEYYVQYYYAGSTTVYIIEYDAQGNPTYNYGAVDVVLPEIEDNGDDPDDPDDPDEPTLVDRFAVTGTGNAYYTFGVMKKGVLNSDNLQESMLAIGQAVVEEYDDMLFWYELFGWEADFTLLDFLNDAEYYYTDFYAVENGEYDVLIVGMNENGNLTGQYSISTVNVDGHELAMEIYQIKTKLNKAIAKKVGKSQKMFKSMRKGLTARKALHFAPEDDGAGATGEDEEITITIEGNLTQMPDWQAVYLGRYEYVEEDDDDEYGPDYPFEGTLQLQSNWSVSLVGEPYSEDGYIVIDIEVNLPGIQYYLVEENNQEDIEDYYWGDIANIPGEWQSQNVQELKSGATVDEILWSENDPATWIYVYNGGSTTTIYVFEFDKDGWATGRYSATEVTMPEYNSNYIAAPKQKKVRVHVKR